MFLVTVSGLVNYTKPLDIKKEKDGGTSFQVEYQDVWACYKFGSVKEFPEIVVVSKTYTTVKT